MRLSKRDTSGVNTTGLAEKNTEKCPGGVTSNRPARLTIQQGMPHRTDDIVLVQKAQLGDRDSLNRLAETARVRLHEFVLRLTLNEDLAQDIVQETMLEMLRIFDKLRKAEMFWPWLCGIAVNKTRNHYGKLWRRKTRNFSETGYEPGAVSGGDTLSDVVTAEFRNWPHATAPCSPCVATTTSPTPRSPS